MAKEHLHRDRYAGIEAKRSVYDYVDYHEHVVDALIEGDGEAACVALRKHLRSVFDDLDAVQAEGPEIHGETESRRISQTSHRQ